ncbi:MAG: CDP-alcohol phosphatidyltransferase [Gemmataceae bacterium]|nr:CDP-alcohol phosphatidyltransferase [Gemmataceae bacterium]
MGLVAAGGIAVCIVRGDPASLVWGFVLMLIATVIDATDGTLARAVRVKEVLPGFDGGKLDDIVDFLTYTALPLLLIWRTDILPDGQREWVLVPLLASAYGFCQVNAKTSDGYFLGFPSYWNLIAFYLYLLHYHVAPLPAWASLSILIGFALLTFVPSRYLYPSQRGTLNRVTNVFAAAWAGSLLWIMRDLLAGDRTSNESELTALILVSLLFPAYYLIVSWFISIRLWFRPSETSP